jgi:hypothetical protein
MFLKLRRNIHGKVIDGDSRQTSISSFESGGPPPKSAPPPNRAIAAQLWIQSAKSKIVTLLLHLNPQIAQLPIAYWSRRVHHQIHGAGGLGERDHFAKALGAGQDHHNAVEA